MWVVFSFLTAFCETAKDVIGKKATHKTDEYITAFSLQLFGCLTLIPILLIIGIPEIKPLFWLAALGFCFTIPTASVLYMRAIKLSPLSVSVPMLAFNPIFTALNAFLFDKKYPSTIGWIGIILVCSGLYVLRLDREIIKKGVFYPLGHLLEEPGSLAMLGVAFIWSFGAHLSKLAVNNSSPLFAAWVGSIAAGIVLLATYGRKTHFNLRSIRSHFWYLAPLGILDGFSNLSMNTALASGLTTYVISIKRTNILWSSIMGKFIFGDVFNKFKVIGLLCMISGIVLILK